MIGQTLGPYQVLSKLGEGGMGQVFRARDTRLGRDVAIKVLPESFAHDGDRRARLEREARVLASLNHPHIAAIHGIEESGGHIALVLELVEGPTLADRLERGPLHPTEALNIARQIAEALDTAHERGIVHRDLKPANIKLAPDRGVKVLDFGLAKAFAENPGADLSQPPTAMATGTREGLILGTVLYMSPEQARGQAVDKRTDIWAFGCVLYEMLTGRRTFAGATLSDTLVAILEREPDWSALPAATPARVRGLLLRCLDKDSRRRLRDIGDAAVDLIPSSAEATVVSPVPIGTRPSRVMVVLGALALIFLTAIVTAWIAGGSAVPASLAALPVRFAIPPPPGATFGGGVPDVETTQIALSPDGSQLAFVATPEHGPRQIWVHPLSSLDARRITGTEGAISVFWSPDSQSIGFFADGKLKRLDLPDGAPVPLADVPTNLGVFGTWGQEGRILFASIQGLEILQASTSGEPLVPVVKAEVSRQEARLFWPWFLPDGKQFLYNARRQDGTEDVRLVEPGGATRSLLSAVSNVEWVDPGYLVFAREGTLLAQRVDLARGGVTGEPVAVADSINYAYTPSRAMFTTSRNGTIVYQSHSDVMRLVWIDRSGKELGSLGDPAGYYTLRLSPDGKLLLYTRVDPRYGTADLWLHDLERGTSTRETSGPSPELVGPWMPGQRGYVFSSGRGGAPKLFAKDLTTGTERALLSSGGFQIASDVSPDAKQLLMSFRKGGGAWDVMTLPLSPAATPSPLLHSPFSEFGARLSPDARAVVYQSDESGRAELYVAPFPLTGSKMLLSSGGASTPRWSRDSSELFYLSADRRLMTVTIRTTPALEVGTPRALFTVSQRAWIDFDVSPDGKRFLAIVSEKPAREQPLTVILNWRPETRR